MAVSVPQLQQRIPFVDSGGKLSNEGLRALNGSFKSVVDAVNAAIEAQETADGAVVDAADAAAVAADAQATATAAVGDAADAQSSADDAASDAAVAQITASSALALATTALQPGDVPTLSSGSYTPTLVSGANVAALTANPCTYTRVGDVVSVSGRVDVQATAGAVLTVVGIPLPIASNFAAATDCNGTTACAGILQAGAVEADIVNDRASLRFIAQDTTSRGMIFNFSYVVI